MSIVQRGTAAGDARSERRTRLAEVHACGDLTDDDRGDDPVDDHAERRPPSRVDDVVGSVLPEVLEPVADHASHEQPRRSRYGRGGYHDEGESHAGLDGNDL